MKEIVQSDLPFPPRDLDRQVKVKEPRFSKDKQAFVTKLISKEYYLIERKRGRRSGYVLYHGNMNPEKWYSEKSLRFLYLLFKKDKRDHITLNLSLVRQLHGKTMIKQLYKSLKKQNNGLRSNITR